MQPTGLTFSVWVTAPLPSKWLPRCWVHSSVWVLFFVLPASMNLRETGNSIYQQITRITLSLGWWAFLSRARPHGVLHQRLGAPSVSRCAQISLWKTPVLGRFGVWSHGGEDEEGGKEGEVRVFSNHHTFSSVSGLAYVQSRTMTGRLYSLKAASNRWGGGGLLDQGGPATNCN